jgi:acyl carrier protein
MDTFDERLAVLCGLLQPHAEKGIVVTAETMLASDLGIDSAQLMEVLLEVEDEFDVSIPLNVLPNVQTVEELMNELQKLIAAAG